MNPNRTELLTVLVVDFKALGVRRGMTAKQYRAGRQDLAWKVLRDGIKACAVDVDRADIEREKPLWRALAKQLGWEFQVVDTTGSP